MKTEFSPEQEPVAPGLFQRPGRLEAFSDGVFAIAITLLVLEIHVPPLERVSSDSHLWQALGERWPSYLALLLSFGTIYAAWVGHHQLLQRVKVIQPALVWTNGVFLLCITLLPFVTALVSEYLTHPGGSAAVALYAGLNASISVIYLGLYRTIHHAGEASPQTRSASRVAAISTGVCLGAAMLALVTPIGALLLIGAVWLRNAWLQSRGEGLTHRLNKPLGGPP